jgi:hypothetical protein
MSKPSTLENFWNRPSVDNGLEIVLDPLRHSKPGEPKRKQAVSICHGVWLRPFCAYPAWAWSECRVRAPCTPVTVHILTLLPCFP